MIGSVENITSMWGGPGALVEAPPEAGEYKQFVYEFAIVRPDPIARMDTLLVAAKAFALGAARAEYNFDVFAILVREGTQDTANYPVVQVVFQFTEWDWIGDLGKLNEAVQSEIVKSSVGSAIGSVKMLKTTEPEAKVLSVDGGIAPMFTVRGGKVSTTKSGANPSPKQVLLGDVRNLNMAIPFNPGQSSGLVDDETPSWVIFGLAAVGTVAIAGALAYLSFRGEVEIQSRMRNSMFSNGRRRRRRRLQ